jgi:hypothetical protein
MTSGTLRGALAGAAGTTALNAATYLDMTLRAGSWAGEDWASDAVPHLLYGTVTTAVLRTGEA